MKRTIQFLTVAVLMGLSAGLSAQTMFKTTVSPTSEFIQKQVLSTPLLKAPAPAVSTPPATSCPPVLDRQTIIDELRNSWAQQYQEMLKERMAAYNACVSDCLSRLDVSSFPADDPNNPKDISVTTVVGICQQTCS